MMECRLCLNPEPSEFIWSDSESLKMQILSCCQLQVEKDDGLPDRICSFCKSKLELFSQFKHSCEQSDKFLKERLTGGFRIKVEEKILSDEEWTSNSPICFKDDRYEKEMEFNVVNIKVEAIESEPTEISIVKIEKFEPEANPIKEEPKEHFTATSNEEYFLNTHEATFKCDVCPQEFHGESHLADHLKVHTDDDNNFKCERCGLVFKEKRILRFHMFSHKGEVSISSTASNGKIKRHLKFQCKICSTVFMRKFSFMRHMLFHSKEKTLKCDICSKAFTLKYNLERHIKTHSTERTQACTMCDKAFVTKESLNQHTKTHTTNEELKCDTCSKTFHLKRCLEHHMKIHAGEKQYGCSVCGRDFYRKCDLKNHMKKHTDTRTHKCTVCDKTFNYKYKLKNHMKTHSDVRNLYDCDVCSKGFTSKYTLTRHAKTHSGNKTHICEVCQCAFYQKSNLQKHMKVHDK